MLKNKNIISQLTDSQKVRLLTDVGGLSGKDFKILGLRGVTVGNMKDYGRDIFPRASILAHSWDEQLWYDVATAKTKMIMNDGADIAIAPGAKIKFSPYRREITEDPFFASRFSSVHASASRDLGVKTALSGFYFTETDIQWMDKEPSQRVVKEFMTAPYSSSVDESDAYALMTDLRSLPEEYKNISLDMQDEFAKDKYLICESASEENTVPFISRGIICLSASSNALETAMNRYKKLKGAIDKGEGVTPEQLSIEEKAYRAISGETVDKALDRVIDFILEANVPEANTAEQDCGELAFKATLESSVLLKNRVHTLPLDKNKSIALIGGDFSGTSDSEKDLEQLNLMADELRALGYNCVAVELGYDTADIQRNSISERAVRATDFASTVILFLGFDKSSEGKIHRTKTLDLPPNQLKLADMLIKRKKTVVGVIASGHAPDIAFTRRFAAVMLAPLGVESSNRALISLLTGEHSPSGKLAYTLYAESDTAFRKRELYKYKYGIKSGPFIGYRYYDKANVNVGYPFGHGLSYSKFEYSHISFSNGMLNFTVENVGTVPADEIAEVYIRCCSDAVIRPEKELCGFSRLSLHPGEKKTVSLKIKVPKVYSAGSCVIERGEYEVMVGASLDDIRLSMRVNVSGSDLMPDGEKLKDYIQSVTNVTEDNFTLEATYCPMKKKSFKNMLIGFCLLALAVSIAVFNIATDLSSVFLGLVTTVLAVIASVYLVFEMLERNKKYEEDRKIIDEKNKEYFGDAKQLTVLSIDRMFNEEFDTHTGEDDALPEAEEDIDDEISKYINPGFRMADFAKELARFAEGRGMKIDLGTAENLAVSLATSRLIVLDGVKSEDFNQFILILSDYFATRAYVDKIDGNIKDSYALFFSNDSHGDYVKKSSVVALEDAIIHKDKVQLLAIDGVNKNVFEQLSKPFAGYITSPKEKNEIKIYNEHGANVGYNIPRNLKIIVRLTDRTPMDTIPTAMLRTISYSSVSYVKCKPVSEHYEYHGCNRYQLEYMLEKEGYAGDVNDKVYARIDKLENYVSAHSGYKIGNKLWLNFEKQMGLLLSVGKDMEDATDIAVATKLLPSMAAAIRGNLTAEDDTLKGTLEFIFGDDSISACMKFINSLQDKNNNLNSGAVKSNDAKKTAGKTDKKHPAAEDQVVVMEEYDDVVLEENEQTAKK